jgi:hypothetical protein
VSGPSHHGTAPPLHGTSLARRHEVTQNPNPNPNPVHGLALTRALTRSRGTRPKEVVVLLPCNTVFNTASAMLGTCPSPADPKEATATSIHPAPCPHTAKAPSIRCQTLAPILNRKHRPAARTPPPAARGAAAPPPRPRPPGGPRPPGPAPRLHVRGHGAQRGRRAESTHIHGISAAGKDPGNERKGQDAEEWHRSNSGRSRTSTSNVVSRARRSHDLPCTVVTQKTVSIPAQQ